MQSHTEREEAEISTPTGFDWTANKKVSANENLRLGCDQAHRNHARNSLRHPL